MIDGLIAGKLYGAPQQRTAKTGKPFAVAKVRCAAGDGESLFVNVIAFDGDTCTALLAMPPEVANPMRLENWIVDYCRKCQSQTVSTREIQRTGPGGLRDKETIKQAVAELVDLGRVRVIHQGRKRLIEVNPAILAEVS